MPSQVNYPDINVVDDRRLCTECGACYGVCPKSNIAVSEDPNGILQFRVKDPSRCGRCALCIRVCPGMQVDFDQLNRDIFGSDNQIQNAQKDIGVYKRLFLGHALDDTIRRNGASGGVATALLAKALEDKLIDGVFVVRLNSGNEGYPLSAKLSFATNANQLFEGQQSKYTSVPMAKCLQDILYHGANQRYGFVGLGCHMQALRKAERLMPELKKRIRLRVGLVCGHCMDWRGTRHLLDLLDVKEADLQKIEYRSDRWPGNFKATLKDGTVRRIGQIDWTSYVMTLYEKHRCHFCTDPLNQFADIAVGDPWLNELSREPGLNLIISRTGIGDRFLSQAIGDNQLAVTETGLDKIVKSQRRSLYRKRCVIRAYIRMARIAGQATPEYIGQFDANPLTWREYREAIVLAVFRTLAAQPIFRRPLVLSGRQFIRYMRKRRVATGRMVLK